MQKHPDGLQPADGNARPDRRRESAASRLNRRAISAVRALRTGIRRRASAPAGSLRMSLAISSLRPAFTVERALPIAVASLVAAASLLAVLPTTPHGAVGGTQGRGTDVRLAVNGGLERGTGVELVDPGLVGGIDGSDLSFAPVTIPEAVDTEAGADTTTAPEPMLEDGTLLTGYAPDTTVADGSDLIQTYKVKSGDSLVSIAHKFGVKTMTLWWANKLESKDTLHIGQMLRIPTVNGIVVTVKDTDTLASLAAKYHVTAARILEVNELGDPTLVVGQVLIVPDAKGAPMPTPKPTPKPVYRPSSGGHSSGGGSYTGGVPSKFAGGAFHWPVVGGNNYVSQYFHYGHYGVDIAASYGSPVVAAAGGRVVFAGWKNNGGGYQVWVAHGSGIYTTYNHMSGLSVGSGQYVSRGQQVGRIGATGHATGPHLHFEVWNGGEPWSGGSRVNPLRYY